MDKQFIFLFILILFTNLCCISCSQGRVFEHGSRRTGYFAIHFFEHLGDPEKNVEQVLLNAAKADQILKQTRESMIELVQKRYIFKILTEIPT